MQYGNPEPMWSQAARVAGHDKRHPGGEPARPRGAEGPRRPTGGGRAPLMPRGAPAGAEAGKATCTFFPCPGFSAPRATPPSRWGGTPPRLTGWWTYTGTTSVPATLPVLDTVNAAVTV